MDIQMMEQQLKGFEAKGKELREQEAIFLKAQGLREQIEGTRAASIELEVDIQEAKEGLAELKSQKASAVAGTVSAIKEKMDAVLPDGEAVISVDGSLAIGWKIGNDVKAYNGLSGGEKVVFDAALANALGSGIMLYEGAEMDDERMTGLIESLDHDKQVIINTCHFNGLVVPEGWDLVEIG